jgi:hypothetical protein
MNIEKPAHNCREVISMNDEYLYFNGINGASGGYLLPPIKPEELGRIALGQKWDKSHMDELNWRREQVEEATFALKAGLNPQDLAQAGWGVVFPAAWDSKTQAAISEALSDLLKLRRTQAGALYKEYQGGNGHRPNESKDDFLSRHGAAPGPVDPAFVPYYLLLVADPQTIPYRFQYELDVSYAVGRIYFDTLDEYAAYARSVVTAESPGGMNLARKATFFGVANPGDKATQLSAEYLIKPLAARVAADQPTWQVQVIPPEEAYRERLQRLMGGDETPAMLFTASHGMGFPYDDPRQLPYQGALLCQDWPGPSLKQQEVPRESYMTAEDIDDRARLLGLISFHFACFGAGTPYWDDYARQAFSTRSAIAPRAFLAALPQRLLGHPHGGSLAVIGHVDRAWSYSFKWGEAGSQTITFQSALNRLMSGETVGAAIDDLNLRYAEISTMLSNEIEEAEYQKPDMFKLARLWTANNDARGYALLGDPAVRLPVGQADSTGLERPVLAAVPSLREELPPTRMIEPTPLQTMPQAAPIAPFDQPLTTVGAGHETAEDFMIGSDALKQIRDNLNNTLQTLATRLAAFVENVTSLNVSTYVSDEIENTRYDPLKKTFSEGARQRALTHISLDGDTQVCVPTEAGEVDEAIWEIHSQMVEQAMANRTDMIKMAAEILTNFLPKIG